ncbi:MAG: stage V sporulation protein E [Bacilli bacterium]|nr:stage V sporulation protein E [Bacilli bacterium]
MRLKKINFDLILFFAVIIISLFGVLMIYSSSSIWAEYKFQDSFKYLKSQSLFLIVGIVLMLIISKFDYNKYKSKANLILGVCFLLLILVLIPGIGSVRNGSRSWFGIGPFGIQPSEFTKLALIIFTAKYLEKNQKLVTDVKKGVFPILGLTLLAFGIIMLQPDFGTGTIIVMTIVCMLFVSGVKMGFFMKIGVVGIIGVVALIIAAPYRLARILSFVDPWKDPLGTGFQIIQSLYAIGPGGLLGMGLGNSIQKHFYLPEPQTDFIFSIISEELGFLGIIIVSTLFLTIIYRGIKISLNSKDLFGKYLGFGMIFQLSFQAILNLMVVVGLIPVTGVTLPFLSYGGSSLLITMVGMGILLNISRFQK